MEASRVTRRVGALRLSAPAALKRRLAEFDPLPDHDIRTYCLTRFITVVPLVWIVSKSLVGLLEERTRPALLAGFFVLVGLIIAAQTAIMTVGTRRPSDGRLVAILGAQAALTYLPLLWYGGSWTLMAGPLAASVLLVDMRGAWLVWSLVILSVLGICWASAPFLSAASNTVSAMLLGWMIWGLSRLCSLVAEVHKDREELARAAVTRERLRFSRDLHDLVGSSLSSIVLRGELAHRLAPAEAHRAREEIKAIVTTSRQTLTELRLVARSYRGALSFAEEQAAVRSVLTMAGVDVTMEITDSHPLPPTLDEVLAIVLREGAANVIRHSEAETCHVTFTVSDGMACLVMVNDAVCPAAAERRGGQGLANLGARLAALGGRAEARVREDGRFVLLAEAPLNS
ncbi:sensor histidine kinase [Streptomyces sp. NPDC057424]|uniref:sensor histidine kinase n=1 Tax=Streptomyces sp. NPDC057424 TaxID=3346127 RepID=UPI0036D117F1